MGKAQSKRSVDITTENKEGVAVAEGESGKVGKIEDIDQKPQLNGDATKEADSGVSDCFHLISTPQLKCDSFVLTTVMVLID